jgi:restriction endonuclease S subunit
MKLKYVSQGVQTGITPPSEQLDYFEEEVNWYTPGDFSFDLLLKDSKRKLSELAFEDGVARYFPANSVLLVGIGATLGKVGYIDKPASSNQQINAIFFDNLEQAKYYSYYLLVNQPNVVSYANASTLAILNQAQTKDIPVIVPDFEEMKQIVSYLEVETTKIDNMVCEVEKAISKLQEYRTALITATVTGKINISN